MKPKTFSMPPGNERMLEIACPVCGGALFRPYWDCGSFFFVACRNCGHVHQNPQPLFEDLAERYQEEYFRYELDNAENFFDLMRLGLEDIGLQRIEEGISGPRRFLDIGCATGRLLVWVRDRGWEPEGVEICRPAAEYGRRERGLSIHTGTLETAGLASGSFNFIHFSHVIEHVPEPRNFLAAAAALLVPGGHLVVVTPNPDSLQAVLFGTQWRSAIADHLHLFRRALLRRLLLEAGLLPKQWVTWGGLAKGLAPDFIKRPIDRLAKRFGFGDVMLCYATKYRSFPGG